MLKLIFLQVCPVCAAYPGGEPNHVIDDLAAHLMLEHRSSTNELISFKTTFNNYLVNAEVVLCCMYKSTLTAMHIYNLDTNNVYYIGIL